jgi:hypothetical protein
MNQTEKIMVQADPRIIEVTLTPEKFPEAFEAKVLELLDEGVYDDRVQAEKFVRTTPIILEIIYEPGQGLFAIESEALETGTCVSPYSSLPVIPEK